MDNNCVYNVQVKQSTWVVCIFILFIYHNKERKGKEIFGSFLHDLRSIRSQIDRIMSMFCNWQDNYLSLLIWIQNYFHHSSQNYFYYHLSAEDSIIFGMRWQQLSKGEIFQIHQKLKATKWQQTILRLIVVLWISLLLFNIPIYSSTNTKWIFSHYGISSNDK